MTFQMANNMTEMAEMMTSTVAVLPDLTREDLYNVKPHLPYWVSVASHTNKHILTHVYMKF